MVRLFKSIFCGIVKNNVEPPSDINPLKITKSKKIYEKLKRKCEYTH